MPVSDLQIVVPRPDHAEALNCFFMQLKSNGDDRYFHPHDLTEGAARSICAYEGQDYYCLMLRFDEVIAYGMLRGWDEGYQVPALGIAVSPEFRGTGAGKTMMAFLHLVARLKKSERVMLKVYKENSEARALFESFGYRFEDYSEDMFRGTAIL